MFIILGGWGNGFGNGYGGNNGGIGGLYPWMNQTETINDGFRDQMLNTNITSIRDGINNISTQLCNGFSQAEIAENGRQMANMNQMFALQSALQNCCCENRASVADLKYTVATEACADRAAISEALRDVIEANTASTQRILDQLCQDKIDAKNDEISQLRSQLQFSNLQASQVAQNAAIVDGIYNRLDTCPVGTTPVYGRTPIFSCNNNGCGCGNSALGF